MSSEPPRYRPDGEVMRQFLTDRSRVRIIQGPIGSGKSVSCDIAIYKMAIEQEVHDGKRRTKALVVRDTYSKLEETTIPTWLAWFPEERFGRFYWSKPFKHEVRIGNVELDVLFVALEDSKDIEFFRSFECTIVYFNELQYIDRALFDEAVTRVGRFPRIIDGGPSWWGVIADMNAPPSDHWVPIMRGDVPAPDWMTEDQKRSLRKPDDWRFFVQPPGMLEVIGEKGSVLGYETNPGAENLKFLPAGYYPDLIKGKTRSWIDSTVMNRCTVLVDGKPVYSDFRREVHVAAEPLKPIPGLPIVIGHDFGRQPAALFLQNLRGRWYALHELIGVDMGASKFGPILKAEMAQRYAGHQFQIWGDPSGDFRGQADEKTPFQIYRSLGIPVRPAPSNLRTIRMQATEAVLTRMVEGVPALIVSPTCTTYIAGMAGGYHFRRLAVSGERYSDEPEKNQYSHVCEAGEYAFLGGGEGRLVLTGGAEKPRPKQTRRAWPVFAGRR